MELALICAQQVIVLFLLIGAGAAAIKTGVLKPEGRQTLSNLLVYLVVPAMIVHSYMMDFSEEILHNLLAAFGLSVLAILIGTVLTLALTARQKDRRAPIFRFASVFSNAAYMGFPLISALFGSEGLLYASAYVTVFNILLWTMATAWSAAVPARRKWPAACCAPRCCMRWWWASPSTCCRSRCPPSSPSRWNC